MIFSSLNRMVLVVAMVLTAGMAQAVTIDLVPIGNPGNAGEQSRLIYNDTNYYGSVGCNYQIGKYDITAGQYTAFLNAVAGDLNPYGLWNSSMQNIGFGSPITKSGSVYTAIRPNQPINLVSWGDAARFCNWMSNGQPMNTLTGNPVLDASTTEDGSYYLNGKTSRANLMTITRKANATWVLPTENEWYKAAYFDPNKVSPGVGGYWLYPTKSDTAPINTLPDTGNNANFYDYYGTGNHSYTLGDYPGTTSVDAFANSESAYGTLGQGGNVYQWDEAAFGNTSRGWRGGAFSFTSDTLMSSYRISYDPTFEDINIGFRIACVVNSSNWKGPGGGNFNLASNWTNNIAPNGVDEAAFFSTNITAPSMIALDSPVTLGTLTFNSPESYTFAGASNMILQVSGGNANVKVLSGSHEISVPVVINSDTLISGAGTLNSSGGISGTHKLTVLGDLTVTSIQVDTLNIGVTGANAVPEPSTLILLSMGFFGLIAWAWHRTRKTV